MRKTGYAFLFALAFATPSFADDEKPHRTINVHDHGAKCNGTHDDTAAFRKAINRAPVGGMVLVPPGRCVVSDTLVIDPSQAVSIVGAGRASQIFQRSNKTLFEFQTVNALIVKDLFLGSAATAPAPRSSSSPTAIICESTTSICWAATTVYISTARC
jgi:Pectate lyase superfamily protein